MSHLFRDPLGKDFGSDAFGRLRVSDTYTLGDYRHVYAIDPEFYNVTSGVGATTVFISNKACVDLVSGISTNGYCIHQTRKYHHYLPGKSQQIFSSFTFGSAKTNVTKRSGYFDDKDGIYFEQQGDGTLSFVIRSYATGVVSERRVTQSQWNKDKLDGSGPSGYNLDLSKIQLFICDFEWLGAGGVRCGFAINNENILAHQFENSNTIDSVYMTNPSLPIRCEVRNTGTVGAAGSFSQVCATVMSEGGYIESGREWSHTISPRTVSVGSTLPVLMIKLKNTYLGKQNRANVNLVNLSVFTSGGNVKYEVVKYPSNSLLTSSGTWVSKNDNSAIEYNQTSTVVTNTYYEEFLGGYASGNSQNVNVVAGSSSNSQIGPQTKKNFITQNYDSTDSEVFSVIVTNIDGSYSANVGVSLQWREVY